MTPSTSPIGDDDLQAYVDGRLPPERAAALDAYLGVHPEIAARIALERRQREVMRRGLAGKSGEPIPPRLRIAAIRTSRRARLAGWTRGAAAAVLLLAVGSAAGWMARGSAPAVVPQAVVVSRDAASAYRTFVVEVAHPVEVGAANEAHLVQWLSKRLGRPLAVPDLARFGYKLMGGRLLPAGAAAAAMLMYEDPGGARLSVYVRAGSSGETAFQFGREGDVSTFAWLDQGYGFAVSATTGRAQLLPIAEAVYRALDTPAASPVVTPSGRSRS